MNEILKKANHPDPKVRMEVFDGYCSGSICAEIALSTIYNDTAVIAASRIEGHEGDALLRVATASESLEVCLKVLEKINSIKFLSHIYFNAINQEFRTEAYNKGIRINKEKYLELIENHEAKVRVNNEITSVTLRPKIIGWILGLLLGSPIVWIYLKFAFKAVLWFTEFMDPGPTRYGSQGFIKGFMFVIAVIIALFPLVYGMMWSSKSGKESKESDLTISENPEFKRDLINETYIRSISISATIGAVVIFIAIGLTKEFIQ